MTDENPDTDDLNNLVRKQQYQFNQLTYLFGVATVEQASMIDVVDLNLDERMTACIADGINRLKNLHHSPADQLELVRSMEAGQRLLLCMWIIEMDLLNKIQSRPYSE